MNVEITVKIEGREVAVIPQEIFLTKAISIEEQTERLKDRVGQVVLEQSFEHLDAELNTPCCCGRRMENRGQRGVTWMSQSGEIRVVRKHYRCRECGDWQRPLDQVVCLGPHRITKHLGKLVCQLATLEHFPQLEKLLFDQHQVALGHDEMMQLVHEAGHFVFFGPASSDFDAYGEPDRSARRFLVVPLGDGGNRETARKCLEQAMEHAPTPQNKAAMKRMLERLANGQTIDG